MEVAIKIARHLSEIHFGGNWTGVCLEEVLEDVTWQEAIAKPIDANSIAMLVFHMNFYLNKVHERLKRTNSQFEHEDSFALPSITNEEEWQHLLDTSFIDARNLVLAIEDLDDNMLNNEIAEGYGSVYKNLHGVVEHNHYHLGQIVLLKKIIRR